MIGACADISALTLKNRWYVRIGIDIRLTGHSLNGDWSEGCRPVLMAAITDCFVVAK